MSNFKKLILLFLLLKPFIINSSDIPVIKDNDDIVNVSDEPPVEYVDIKELKENILINIELRRLSKDFK